MVWGYVLVSLIYMQLSSFPSTTCWNVFFPFYILISFVKNYLTVGVWVYFWALYSGPLIHISIFIQNPHCFDYCSLIILSESGRIIPPALFFSIKIALAILGILWFHINFWIVCSSSVNYQTKKWLICPSSLYKNTCSPFPLQRVWSYAYAYAYAHMIYLCC